MFNKVSSFVWYRIVCQSIVNFWLEKRAKDGERRKVLGLTFAYFNSVGQNKAPGRPKNYLQGWYLVRKVSVDGHSKECAINLRF